MREITDAWLSGENGPPDPSQLVGFNNLSVCLRETIVVKNNPPTRTPQDTCLLAQLRRCRPGPSVGFARR